MKKSLLVALSAALVVGGCSNEGHAPGGQDASMMYVTGPVGGASLMSMSESLVPKATTGASLNKDQCSGCGTNLNSVHGMASIFALQGKLADNNSCMIAAVIANDAVPGITSGEAVYISTGQVQLKVKLKMNGTEVSSFAVQSCVNGVQLQHISGTNSGGTGTFKFRSGSAGSTFAAMDATGTLSGGEWTSKTLTVGFASAGTYYHYVMEQKPGFLDIKGVLDSGTLGTLDGADLQMVARVQLIGDSLTTYALGDGSIRKAIGNGAASNTNWNGDTKAEGSGPTTYDSAVSSATLPSIPTSRVSAFTTEETWDCTMSNPVNLMQVAASNQALMKAAMACQEIFE